ncbi:hypothetical protein CL633_01475 [bacterium]|nr:hypothetical protein [bacterium]|tara:strand:+ start:2374 stop:3015 length:642 start_codon:yes stop_codon:yes gene_type:complete
MIFNKNNLLLHQLTSKNKTRPELGGVLFKKDKTVATDSYILGEVKNTEEYTNDIKEYPQLSDKSSPMLNFSKKGYIIPAKAVKKIISNLAGINAQIPILDNCIFTMPKTSDTSNIVSTDLEQVDAVTVKNIDSDYPNYGQIMPDENVKKQYKYIRINRKKLKQLVDLVNQFDIKHKAIEDVKIGIKGDSDPLLLEIALTNDAQFTGLIMPIQS